MSSPLTRFATRTASMARSRAMAASASVHTTASEAPLVDPKVYEPEEFKYDASESRDARFPRTVNVVEGGPRVSFPDYPTIVRHSLTEPGWGSYGHSLREPNYNYVPKRYYNQAPPARRRRGPRQAADEDNGVDEFLQQAPTWRLL